MKAFTLLVFAVVMTSCQFEKAELGSAKNPIKIFFVPSVEAKILEDQSARIKTILEKLTPYKYEIKIPASFVAVVEAFGAKKADIAALNTFGYILAHEKYQAEAKLTVIRYGRDTYQSQIIAKTNSKINSLKDLVGKKFAFVDPASTSGYLLPFKLLKDKSIKLSSTVFAMRHDNVVSMVYQGQVDAGATYYVPPEKGVLQDARQLVITQYPDVEKKIKIVQLTDPIPNEPVVFRKDMPEKIKQEIVDAFLKLAQLPEGKEALEKVSAITELKVANDKDYEPIIALMKSLGASAEELMSKGK
jgi:phosphonate transport system substrate-binding protein